MKGTLLAITMIFILSSGGFSSEIKGVATVIDADSGTLEVAGVEIVTVEDLTIMEDRQKRPAALTDFREGDYVEIEGRFVAPAKFEATKITVGKVLPPRKTVEVIDSMQAGEEAKPKPEPVKEQAKPGPAKKEAEPAAAGPPSTGGDKLSGSLKNADVKTRILVVDGTIVTLGAGAKILGAGNKAVSIEKLRRGSKVTCEGRRLSKKEFLATTVKVLK